MYSFSWFETFFIDSNFITVFKNKYRKIKYLKREAKENLVELQSSLGYVLLCVLNKSINNRISGLRQEWKRTQERKLAGLFEDITQLGAGPRNRAERPRNIVHNFSTYELTAEEYHILTYGLDHHIPSRLDETEVKAEFEAYFYGLSKQLGHLSSIEKDELKTKIRKACENYYKIRNNNNVEETISRLSKNKNIRIVKQDKGRGVVILNNTKYIEKCQELLNTDNFEKLGYDNTREVEENVQKTLFKIKEALGEDIYKKIYPTGSNPGRFYGTAKVHKVKPDEPDKCGKLSLRPIVSNIGTATHQTARYLCELLSPLSKSAYTVESTKEFVGKIKNLKIPDGHIMISFDVVSLFTNVPLNRTIEIILRKVYEEKLIKTKIKREDMKELLLLCTQGVPFTFNGETYLQIDGVMMGSPLGALFANIFMCELENTVIPRIQDIIKNWTRYVDDTFATVEAKNVTKVENELNKFHESIKFTHEVENDRKISFLDVLIKRNEEGGVDTSVYRKPTNTDIYINWKAHAPVIWKIATLKSLIKRAFLISSTEVALEEELSHIQRVFCDLNDYPLNLVKTIIANEKSGNRLEAVTRNSVEVSNEETDEEQPETVTLHLPYAGDEGSTVISKLQKNITKTINRTRKKVKLGTIYKATRLGSRFNLKDKISAENQHNIVYHGGCPNRKCVSNYVGQTKCRLEKRAGQHAGTDTNSHLFKHAKKTKHRKIRVSDFKIIGKGFRSDFTRKISESLYVKELKPDLNVQKDAYKLSLFN